MPSQPHIPTYIPFDQAARHYGLPKKVLTQKIRAGKIQAVQLPSGDLLVAAENNGQDYQTKEEIIAQKFAHLKGQTINAYQAQQKYGIYSGTFIRWARAGYIKIIHEEERLLEMDAADVAYCVYVYEQKKEAYGGRVSGVRIFDEDGNPYQVKYPDLAAQRRK
jgi:predicted site-specific integrase-resolvase